MGRRLLAAAVAVLALAGLSACGADSPSGPPQAGATVSTAAARADAPGVPELLRLTSPTVAGGSLDLAAYAGRPVAFWFWAPG